MLKWDGCGTLICDKTIYVWLNVIGFGSTKSTEIKICFYASYFGISFNANTLYILNYFDIADSDESDASNENESEQSSGKGKR